MATPVLARFEGRRVAVAHFEMRVARLIGPVGTGRAIAIIQR
jgi:hypothetical protein